MTHMKRKHALWVFAILLSSAVAAGIDSLLQTGNRVQADINRALALTLRQCAPDRIDADTIRVYRSHIQEVSIRDTAYLTITISDEKNHHKAQLQASSGLTLARLWALSDQRASGTLLMAAVLWLLLSIPMRRSDNRAEINSQRGPASLTAEVNNRGCSLLDVPSSWCSATLDTSSAFHIGRLCYNEHSHRFTVNGLPVHFTPMQHTLMELFMAAPNHILTHQEICDRLWPRKPDASATLYTLVRRLKPVLQDSAGLTIDCQRGVSYQLNVMTISV